MKSQKIPARLQPILWSVDVNHLDIEKDKNYIIHQILRFGSLDDILWLFTTYSKERIRQIFISQPRKAYSRKNLYFIKNYILGLSKIKVDENEYITSIHGKIRQRAAGSL